MRGLFLAAGMALLAGCAVTNATGPMFNHAATNMRTPNQTRVYIYRTKATYLMQSSTVARSKISIDNKTVGYLTNGGFLVIDVPAGIHFITAASGEDYSTKPFTAAPTGIGYIRIWDKTRMAGAPGAAGALAGGLLGGFAVSGIVAMADASTTVSEGRIWGIEFMSEMEALSDLQALRRSD